VFTERDRRGQGIAKALVDSLMAACSELGVRVFCSAASLDGASMYRSPGFVPNESEMILRR
jgi:GNAT superfamily N-acetyltransferase